MDNEKRTKAREFIKSIGGYEAVASSLKKGPTTVHTAMQSGEFPASWYDALCRSARDAGVPEPDRDMFSFIRPPQKAAAA